MCVCVRARARACVRACACACACACVWPSESQLSHADSRFFFAFLSFAESFVVEQQTLFGVDLIHISMISDVKVQC